MSDGDAWLRHHLIFGEYGEALGFLERERGLPGDPLWRALQRALVLHHAGEYAASNDAFEWAEIEADLRYTASVSRGAASLLSSDRVLAYTPSASEMGMIPYYRMLNYLALDDRDGAAVEARKALTRLTWSSGDGCADGVMVLYLAGMVLRGAGEDNDALVALRQAEHGYRGCAENGGSPAAAAVGGDLLVLARSLGDTEIVDATEARYAPTPPAAGGGELMLLLEHGFVAHLTEETLHVPIYPEDVDGVEGGDEPGILEAAARVSARLLGNALERERWGAAFDDHPARQLAHAAEGAYVLRLAWPGARRSGPSPAIRVWVDDELVEVVRLGDLSAATEREIQAARAAAFTRMIARGIGKYLISREAERGAEKAGGEVAGFLVGRLTNVLANGLERADTRSWSLLPDHVSMVRTRLGPGEHRVRLEVVTPDGVVIEEREIDGLVAGEGELVLRRERVMSRGRMAVR
jgi:uncharacterized protein